MKSIVCKTLLILTMAACAAVAPAQDPAELILDDGNSRMGNFTVTKRGVQDDAKKDQTPAAPTPNPEDILVAIVDTRVLTKADINSRVSQRKDRILEGVQSTHGGVVAVIGGDPQDAITEKKGQDPDVAIEERQMLEEQKKFLEEAILQAEKEALMSWVDHSILAEEARRQGIVVTAEEFRERLTAAEKANRLTADDVELVLDEMRMTRQDYERSVHDALMIEKLVTRFVDLNFDEAYYRAAYNDNPALFYEPRKFRLAHFVISLNGEESKQTIREYRDIAKKVQSALSKGADPDELFARPEFDAPDAGIKGTLPGWFTLQEGMLPILVETEARKLKVGETSDVLVQQRRVDGEIVPSSIHVLKILEERAPTGDTFETAMPAINRAMMVVGRDTLLTVLREARTHKVMTNMSGIPSRLIPTPEEIGAFESKAQPVNLRLPPGELVRRTDNN